MDNNNLPPVYNESLQYGKIGVLSSFQGFNLDGAKVLTAYAYVKKIKLMWWPSKMWACKLIACLFSSNQSRQLFIKNIGDAMLDEVTGASCFESVTNCLQCEAVVNMFALIQRVQDFNWDDCSSTKTTNCYLLDATVLTTKFGVMIYGNQFEEMLNEDLACVQEFDHNIKTLESDVILLVIPHLNLFYCHCAKTETSLHSQDSNTHTRWTSSTSRMRVHNNVSKHEQEELVNSMRHLVPLPLNWLRLDLLSSNPDHSECVVKSVKQATCIVLIDKATRCLEAKHLSVANIKCPLVCPQASQKKIRATLLHPACTTMRLNTRQYLYADTFSLEKEYIQARNVFVVDRHLTTGEGIDFVVHVMGHDNIFSGITTTIKVRYIDCKDKLVLEANNLGLEMRRNPKILQQRKDDGGSGYMYGFGLRNSEFNTGLDEFKATEALNNFYLDKEHFVTLYSNKAAQLFPVEWAAVCNADMCHGLHQLTSFAKNVEDVPCGSPSALYGTVDYESVQHIDFRDASLSIMLLSCSQSKCYCQENADGPYFVFGNVEVKDENGVLYNGVAIRVEQGAMVSFDGRVLRHCTSRKYCQCHNYGYVMAANAHSHKASTIVEGPGTLHYDLDMEATELEEELIELGIDYSNVGKRKRNG